MFKTEYKKLALTLTACLLTSCAMAGRDITTPATNTHSAQATQPPMQIIINFTQQPSEENKQLTTAIAYACRCTPVFFRKYLNSGLIYKISLPQNHLFPAFEKTLLASDSSLGIKAVEQDIIMQHQ